MTSLNIFRKVEDYFVSRLLMLKLESHELIAKLIVLLLSSFLFISMVFLIMFFIGITFSILLGELLGNTMYGFAVTSAFYVFILFILIYFKEKLIENPIMDIVIRNLNKDSEDEEDE